MADSWDDYVAKALALTEDVAALDALRARVRPGFDNSPYRDEAGFTRRLEADYRKMFQRWLEREYVSIDALNEPLMRAYWPKVEVTDGTWTPPAVLRK